MARKKQIKTGSNSGYKLCKGCSDEVSSNEVLGINGYNYCKPCAGRRGVVSGRKVIAKCGWCGTQSKRKIESWQDYYCSNQCVKLSARYAEEVAMGIPMYPPAYGQGMQVGNVYTRPQGTNMGSGLGMSPKGPMGRRAPESLSPLGSFEGKSPFGKCVVGDEDEDWEDDEDEWEDDDDEDEEEWDEEEDDEEWEEEDDEDWEEDEDDEEWDDDDEWEDSNDNYIDENEVRAANAEALFDAIDTVTGAIGDAVGTVGGAVWKMVKNWR